MRYLRWLPVVVMFGMFVKVTQAKESREADLSGEVGELLYQR
jgi:hypothetical protein